MAESGLAALTAVEAVAEIARGALSAEEYARACLERIAAVEQEVHAFAHVDPAYVVTQARALDERRANGQPTGALHGIPVGVKDIFDSEDYPTECGSPCSGGVGHGAMRLPSRVCAPPAPSSSARQ